MAQCIVIGPVCVFAVGGVCVFKGSRTKTIHFSSRTRQIGPWHSLHLTLLPEHGSLWNKRMLQGWKEYISELFADNRNSEPAPTAQKTGCKPLVKELRRHCITWQGAK